MKKKNLFFLLFVMCIGLFLPREVFAQIDSYYTYNFDIDYDFLVNTNTDNDNGSLNFRLYDFNKNFVLESEYSSNEKKYYFQEHSHREFNGFIPSKLYDFDLTDGGKYISNCYDNYYFLRNTLALEYPRLKSNHLDYDGPTCDVFWTANEFIPVILEETSNIVNKKILLANLRIQIYHTHGQQYVRYNLLDYDFTLVNNNSNCYSSNSCVDDNVKFMRNAVYDYSDDLWEELNSGPIASSEMQYDNSDDDLSSPKLFTLKTNSDKQIYSKYKSNINYRFKVTNGNGMNFRLHDISNTFNFSSLYDKDSDTYSIVDNSTDTDYQDGIKEFSKIIIDEVKNGNFSGLANKYKSITSDNCTSTNCSIYTYIPMILEGENKDNYAKQIVLGLMNIQYKEENGNDYYDVSLNVYNNTCDLLNSNIDANQSELINLSRSISEDYSSNLMNQYSDGSISMEDIYEDVDVNTLKDKYCNNLPVISLRQNPKTLNNGIVVLIISMMIVIGNGVFIIKRKNVKV